MPKYHDYDYLFAFSMIGAFVNTYGIGANDVANSFATSVSSKSLTFRQAMLAAAICEFLGAVLVGARVASTIKNGIIDLDVFGGNASVVLLAFTCSIIGSATWLTFATRNAMPVSTTHTTVGSVIGVGVAVSGARGVKWGWNGVAQIFASWGIAPAVAGACAACVYLVTKYVVLKAKNPVMVGLYTAPVYFFIISGVLTVSIIVKGSPSLNLDELPAGTTVAAVLGTASVVALLSVLFWLPYVHDKVVKGDYTVKWYHFFMGPMLWFRPAPQDAITADSAVPDYRLHDFDEPADALPHTHTGAAARAQPVVAGAALQHADQIDTASTTTPSSSSEKDAKLAHQPSHTEKQAHASHLAQVEAELEGAHPPGHIPGRPNPPNYRTFEGSWLEPWNLYTILRYNAIPWVWYSLSAGLRTDIHAMQAHGSEKEKAKLRQMHAVAEQYDNRVEHLYSFMQVMTACTASFAHGANDVSNAIGPLAVVYSVWSTSLFPASKEPVPIWILAFGGVAIVIGLGTYGWKLMSVLGNRLTMHSPSRGFSMELGASITVVLASYLGLPVSSTQSITGATLAVGLCNGDWRRMNWKMLAWIFFSWVLTLPIAGLISGCLLAIVLNAPGWNTPPPVL
ncbi:probable PHO89-Na+/phosphate co-transporter [Sporisorium reilianum SRZ2]|uniref:Phosphate transporter n=1 Tax=Sporisorium reilianum (strain SRZ2) TaxID=999809 RepID=E7A2V2_SPORE|nr:probable PHO89-Na+/phosphate co-transporter [Sporisorium reilianum SRZ2]